jgi:hypothetical protein
MMDVRKETFQERVKCTEYWKMFQIKVAAVNDTFIGICKIYLISFNNIISTWLIQDPYKLKIIFDL